MGQENRGVLEQPYYITDLPEPISGFIMYFNKIPNFIEIV
jgi:hypothetical protein